MAAWVTRYVGNLRSEAKTGSIIAARLDMAEFGLVKLEQKTLDKTARKINGKINLYGTHIFRGDQAVGRVQEASMRRFQL